MMTDGVQWYMNQITPLSTKKRYACMKWEQSQNGQLAVLSTHKEKFLALDGGGHRKTGKGHVCPVPLFLYPCHLALNIFLNDNG